MKQPCVYIMASKRNGTLYTGVTSNLVQRVYQHKNGLIEGFSKKYDCKRLVWYEVHDRWKWQSHGKSRSRAEAGRKNSF